MKHFGSTWPSDPDLRRADGIVNLERVCPIERADLSRPDEPAEPDVTSGCRSPSAGCADCTAMRLESCWTAR